MMESDDANVEAWVALHKKAAQLTVVKANEEREERKRLVKFVRDQLARFLEYGYRNTIEAVEDEQKDSCWTITHEFHDSDEYYSSQWRKIAEDFENVNELLQDCTAFQLLEVTETKVVIQFDSDDCADEDSIRNTLCSSS